ncbi:S-adenosyl-L-methionine-dependent methyltransferase [Ascodesmis nigricans]|uniref:S-adenosyl-L-methionine-dependent methyltransferase n=1 Tax=Ascodesmis nigricans TaxID=341454 RepID=A0A4S2MQA5_9PEZI|nr:S-adenosyl-L-methionine-dependent methyltransferase [Ascodesmis nigricans]
MATDTSPAPIHADNEVTSDWDEESVASSTQSLTESILEHVFENGRRYHRKSKDQYFFPSDDTEQDRLDLVHQLHLELLRGDITMTKFTKDPANVLDCGCGTGIWALDFGDVYPGSHVIGVDIAPLQPGWTAPNVKFELDDLEKEWTYKPNHFNFIHTRHLAAGIKDYKSYVRQIYHHSAPGARLELVEHNLNSYFCDDGTMPKNSAYNRYFQALRTCYKTLGVNPLLHGKEYQQMLEEAGFVDVKLEEYKVPVGTWPKDRKLKRLGWITLESATTGMEAYGHRLFTNLGGLSSEEAKKLIDDVVSTIKSGKEHVYYYEFYLTARKPE